MCPLWQILCTTCCRSSRPLSYPLYAYFLSSTNLRLFLLAIVGLVWTSVLFRNPEHLLHGDKSLLKPLDFPLTRGLFIPPIRSTVNSHVVNLLFAVKIKDAGIFLLPWRAEHHVRCLPSCVCPPHTARPRDHGKG